MRLIDADALAKEIKQDIADEGLTERFVFYRINDAPTIEPRHGLLIPDATLPRKGCYHCMFREGNLCKFLPASVPVVECGKRYERHKECPLVEV
jgi:hypothetical protein